MIDTLKKLFRKASITTLKTTITGLIAAVIAACSPLKILNGVISTDGIKVKTDISYGALPRHTLDIYTPKTKLKGPLPVVIFYYGGGWDSGVKEDYLFVAQAFASKGYVTVIPNYRVFPQVSFPEFMQDPVDSARWITNNIAQYNGDPDNIFIAGHSAGAHLSILMQTNKDYLARVDLTPNRFRGYVGLAGPYDFLPLKTQHLKDIFGPEQQRWKAEPINFVSGSAPPTLIMVGLDDDLVEPENSFSLAKKIRQEGGWVKLMEYPDYSHEDMVAKLAKPLRGNSPLLSDIVAFLELHTKTETKTGTKTKTMPERRHMP